MTWLSRHPLAVVALVAILVLLAFLFVPLPGDGDDDLRAEPVPTLSPRPSPAPRPAAADPEASPGTRPVDGPGELRMFGGPLGLQGEGGSQSTTVRDVTLTVTSDAPVFVLGYIVPTSADRSYGKVARPGSSWSMSTTVYGPPDYAQIFAQAGPKASRIACTVTVDGRVTDRRSATGPYAQLFCQG